VHVVGSKQDDRVTEAIKKLSDLYQNEILDKQENTRFIKLDEKDLCRQRLETDHKKLKNQL